MDSGVGFAAGAMLCLGISDWIYKRAASKGVPAPQFVMAQASVFAPLICVYGIGIGAPYMHPSIVWGLLAGLFVYVGFYNFASSLAGGQVSAIAPIFRMNFVLTAGVAVLVLGEAITLFKTIGLLLAILAIWLLLGRREQRLALPKKTFLQVLLATISISLSNICYKLGIQAGGTPVSILMGQAFVFFPLSVTVVWFKFRKISAPTTAWQHAPFAAIFLFVGFQLLLTGISKGDASVVVPIGQMGFVVTALLGGLIMKEPFPPTKVLGILVALGALVFLMLS